MSGNQNVGTAGEAGWHVSKYNLYARIPGSEKFAVVNLIRGICEAYSFVELCLLDEAETLPENHPIIERFAKSGFIANYDETEALKAMGRLTSRGSKIVSLTICPTMNCNFACTYCFEKHRTGIMSKKVQDDVVSLAERITDMLPAENLNVTWFGGEPLMGMNVITELTEKLRTLAEKKNMKYSADIITNGSLLNQEIVDTLVQCDIKSAQITLDGIGEFHDATRHLTGGGSTFERITEKLAEESGNHLKYYSSPVSFNSVSYENEADISLLCDDDEDNIAMGMMKDIDSFKIKAHFCGASILPYVAIDEQGRLYKCWEDARSEKYVMVIVSV